MNQVKAYVKAFLRGNLGDVDTAGLLGRVIRGKSAKDFETLSDDPDRRFVLLTDPMGLASIVGKPAFQILLAIGWEPGYAIQKILDGFQMKLVVTREGGPARLATWDGMMHSVCLGYPEIAAKLGKWLPDLKRAKFDDLEAAYGCDLSEVEYIGKGDPRFMTLERYQAAEDNLANARAFLYFCIHLREQYAGDGYTYDNGGVRGVQEYIAPNCKLEELLDVEVVDLFPELPNACTIKAKTAVDPILPDYYDPGDVVRRYQPRLDLVTEAAKLVSDRITKATRDKIKRALVGIDLQDSFCLPEIKDADGKVIQPAGELLVTGAADDVRRLVEFIYASPEKISSLILTMDMHTPFQIFFPSWWKGRDGKNVAPFTLITNEAVEKGDFVPVFMKDWSVKYVQKLGAMMIWPYHCMIGTAGANLVPALAEAVHWLSIVRGIQPMYIFKGTVPETEHYGPFAPCVEVPGNPHGTLNTVLLDQVAKNDEIVFCGEAEDFCVKTGMEQVLDYFGRKHPDTLKKVVFLRDATSMVFPNNRQQADDFLGQMAKQGVVIRRINEL